jgi:16S rRNA (cytosine967-C5)-methyltransferase
VKHKAHSAGHYAAPETLAGALDCASAIVAAVIRGESATAAWQRMVAHNPQAAGWARVQDFAWSTLRDYGWGDAVLAALSRRPIDRTVRPLLLVALTELRKGRVPVHALIHEAVAVAKKRRTAAAGFVNALLRRYDRERAQWAPEAWGARSDQAIAAHWRHPRWWVEKIQFAHPSAWQTVLHQGNTHPPMGLRVRSSEKRREVIARLREAGIAAEPFDPLPGAIWLPEPVAETKLPEPVRNEVVIQDIGAQWAAPLLAVRPGERVLDACAAPGGKALHLLDSAAIDLTLVEKEESRYRAMLARFPELSERAQAIVGDAREPHAWWDGRPFDAILLDAPCSGSGVVRRHPDIKWLRRVSDLETFRTVQQALLTALWPLLRPGGRLLYVTCSVFAEENERVIAKFLNNHNDAKRVPTEGVDGYYLPTEQHDGFYYARIEKVAES